MEPGPWSQCIVQWLQLFSDEGPEPYIQILEQNYEYGCEFYGASPMIGLTPLTDKCFLSMSQVSRFALIAVNISSIFMIYQIKICEKLLLF